MSAPDPKADHIDVPGAGANRSFRGRRAMVSGRGRFARSRPQCQICGCVSHLAQMYYYKYDREALTSVVVHRFSSPMVTGGYESEHGASPHWVQQTMAVGVLFGRA